MSNSKTNTAAVKKFRDRAIRGQFRSAIKKNINDEYIKFIKTDPDKKICESWYFIIGNHPFTKCEYTGELVGDDDEFKGGQFIGMIEAPPLNSDKLEWNFPFIPPNVTLYTPTGIFPINNSNFCISMGKFHAKDVRTGGTGYSPCINMIGFIRQIISSMMFWKDLGKGIRLMVSYHNEEEKNKICENIRTASRQSIAYNLKHHKKILDLFMKADHYKSLH